jgi:outer membrane protein assembly factor BamB
VKHSRLMRPIGIALITLVTLAGCESAGRPSPSSVVQPTAGGLDASNFERLWMNILPVDKGDEITRMYVSQDLAFPITKNNVAYVVGKSQGVLKYFRYVNGGGRAIGRPVVLPEYITFTGQSNVEVYKRLGGDLVKSIPLKYTISSDAVGSGDDLFMGIDTNGGELADIVLSRDYVPVRWTLLSFGEVTGSPALYQGVIYMGSGDGGIRAVNTDRTAAWSLDHDSYDTGKQILGDVSADDSGVYAASDSGRLVCVDINSGLLKWQYLAPYPLKSGPVVTATSIYQMVPEVGLAAIDKSKLIVVDPTGRRKVEEMNRTPRWVCADAAQFVSEDAHFTYVRTTDDELWALDRETGQVRYKGTGAHFAAFATNVTDSTIYVATGDGVVYALKPVLQAGSPGYLE